MLERHAEGLERRDGLRRCPDGSVRITAGREDQGAAAGRRRGERRALDLLAAARDLVGEIRRSLQIADLDERLDLVAHEREALRPFDLAVQRVRLGVLVRRRRVPQRQLEERQHLAGVVRVAAILDLLADLAGLDGHRTSQLGITARCFDERGHGEARALAHAQAGLLGDLEALVGIAGCRVPVAGQPLQLGEEDAELVVARLVALGDRAVAQRQQERPSLVEPADPDEAHREHGRRRALGVDVDERVELEGALEPGNRLAPEPEEDLEVRDPHVGMGEQEDVTRALGGLERLARDDQRVGQPALAAMPHLPIEEGRGPHARVVAGLDERLLDDLELALDAAGIAFDQRRQELEQVEAHRTARDSREARLDEGPRPIGLAVRDQQRRRLGDPPSALLREARRQAIDRAGVQLGRRGRRTATRGGTSGDMQERRHLEVLPRAGEGDVARLRLGVGHGVGDARVPAASSRGIGEGIRRGREQRMRRTRSCSSRAGRPRPRSRGPARRSAREPVAASTSSIVGADAAAATNSASRVPPSRPPSCCESSSFRPVLSGSCSPGRGSRSIARAISRA